MRIGLVGYGVGGLDSRFDLDQPQTLEAGPEGGLLRDLGSHLVDQALWLLGPARSVTANLDWLDLAEGRTDAGFVLTLPHIGGAESRELRLFGARGSYVSAPGLGLRGTRAVGHPLDGRRGRPRAVSPGGILDAARVSAAEGVIVAL